MTSEGNVIASRDAGGVAQADAHADTVAERFTAWAGLAFGTAAVFGLALTPQLVSHAVPRSLGPLLAASALATVGVFAALFAGLSARSRRRWATPAAIALLWLIAAQGVLDTATAFTRGVVNIPLGTLIALAILRLAPAPPFTLPAPRRQRAIVFAVVAAAVGAWIAPPAAAWAVGPSAPWATDASSITVRLALECRAAAAPDPATIHARVDWSWSERDAFLPDTDDAIVATWAGADETAFAGWGETSHRMFPGVEAPARMDELAGIANGESYLLDTRTYGERDGFVEFEIRTSAAALAGVAGSLSVAYLHGDAWEATAPTPSCNR